ncbi:MAG: beta-mannanase [Candidatus Coatesbacteria bacterium]
MAANDFLVSGRFKTGCNYWASHAGTNMWRDWDPKVVAKDFDRLALAGLEVLRVFPLWPDFQPLTALRGGGGAVVEYRFGETPLPDTEAGRAGLSEEMLSHFDEFILMAEERDLQLVVGLLTGWMSGRRYLPPAFDHLNPLTDATAIVWEVRFVKAFVRRFKDRKGIAAWDLGNECNCMAGVSRDQAWAWTATIADAIRSEDHSRQIVSGMHSLAAEPGESWRIQDQAELTDVLTTHPYPPFTAHCGLDPIPTFRANLHATAESRLYGDVGGKPCLCEEIGVLGPTFSDDANAAAYLRTQLWSLWAHDCMGLLWWCGFDQDHLAHAPYDWCAVERELGLLRADGTPKPLVAEFAAFRKAVTGLGVPALPTRLIDGVCLLTPQQDQWAVAYSAFCLAKQAGVDIEFQYADAEPLREAPVYLMPSVAGLQNMPRRRWQELLARIEAGATLYLSLGDGVVSGFEALTGLRILSRERRTGGSAKLGNVVIPAGGPYRLNLAPGRAEVLASEEDGNPFFSTATRGKGRVFFLSSPMEHDLALRPGAFHHDGAPACWRVWERVFAAAGTKRAVRKDVPCVGLTEHALSGADRSLGRAERPLGGTERPFGKAERLIVAINYSPESVRVTITPADGWKIGEALRGPKPAPAVDIPANDAIIFTVAGVD